MTNNGLDRIHRFAAAGDRAGIERELASGVAIDLPDGKQHWTALMHAAASPRADVTILRFLLENGANVNAVAIDDSLRQIEAQTAAIFDNGGFLERLLEQMDSDPSNADVFKDMIEMTERSKRNPSPPDEHNALHNSLKCGDLAKVDLLIEAGANVHYVNPSGNGAVTHAMFNSLNEAQRIALMERLIRAGAPLHLQSRHCESALRVASNTGQFKLISTLLHAGADPAELQWSNLHRAVALGTLADVESALAKVDDLESRDFWERTPWLLAIKVGDVAKAERLLAAGSDRTAVGRCGQAPMMYAVESGSEAMLRWLIAEGFDVDTRNEFKSTALDVAIDDDARAAARTLLQAGASLQKDGADVSRVREANSLAMVRLLVEFGGDFQMLNDDVRKQLRRVPNDGELHVSRETYLAQRHRRFGESNPERMPLEFWKQMVRSGLTAYHARQFFDDSESSGAIWCFKRFGQSLTELPDGRIVEIAGEHEDHYDPDFCIYNDVVVHHGDGTFDIFGYPRDVFPPTDFHSATRVDDAIYLIGTLGYVPDRRPGETPIYRLNLSDFSIERVHADGEPPGWIFGHRAELIDGRVVRVSGGERFEQKIDRQSIEPFTESFELDLKSLRWSRSAGPDE